MSVPSVTARAPGRAARRASAAGPVWRRTFAACVPSARSAAWAFDGRPLAPLAEAFPAAAAAAARATAALLTPAGSEPGANDEGEAGAAAAGWASTWGSAASCSCAMAPTLPMRGR